MSEFTVSFLYGDERAEAGFKKPKWEYDQIAKRRDTLAEGLRTVGGRLAVARVLQQETSEDAIEAQRLQIMYEPQFEPTHGMLVDGEFLDIEPSEFNEIVQVVLDRFTPGSGKEKSGLLVPTINHHLVQCYGKDKYAAHKELHQPLTHLGIQPPPTALMVDAGQLVEAHGADVAYYAKPRSGGLRKGVKSFVSGSELLAWIAGQDDEVRERYIVQLAYDFTHPIPDCVHLRKQIVSRWHQITNLFQRR